ncbi:MAG: sulfurtransferase TusA family protein [Hyphomicrobium sp.]|jgi:tRNA 2-thiouridine synthesizing protein A
MFKPDKPRSEARIAGDLIADLTLDARDLKCPLPILKAKKALAGLEAGQLLEVLATDPGSDADFEAFCRATGHELACKGSLDDARRFLIRKTEHKTGSKAK